MVEATPEQAVVALSLASSLYLSPEERGKKNFASLIQSSELSHLLVSMARLALQEDVEPDSQTLAVTHQRQRLILQTRYDLGEGKLRSVEEAAKKLHWTRERARRIEVKTVRRIQCLETPMWQAYKIFFLTAIKPR